MVDFEKQFERPGYAIGRRETFGVRIATTFKIVYGWMCAGLALSGAIAWYTATSGLYKTVLQGPGFMACVIAELVLVFVLSMAIRKMPVALAYLMFNLYTPPCFAALGAMNSEMKSAKWLWGAIALQLATGFTVGYLVYQIGTLITTGSLGAGFLPGLIAIAVFAGVIVYLIKANQAKMVAEYELKTN